MVSHPIGMENVLGRCAWRGNAVIQSPAAGGACVGGSGPFIKSKGSSIHGDWEFACRGLKITTNTPRNTKLNNVMS